MSIRVSRILHAGYVLESGATRIVFDPIFENPFSRNCRAYPDVDFNFERIASTPVNAIFISHYHDDHFSIESLARFDRRTRIYFYTVIDALLDLIRELGFVDVRRLEIDLPVAVGDFRVTTRRALDHDVDSIFEIEAGGARILNVVDSWIGAETMDLLVRAGPWDLVLWPFQPMRETEALSPAHALPPEGVPPEWLAQISALRPRYLVPSSCQFRFEEWSWLNSAFFPVSYLAFSAAVTTASPTTQVLRLEPSAAIFVEPRAAIAPTSSLDWVFCKDTSEPDYVFEPDLVPPTTADIARHFPPLTSGAAARVRDFCTRELLERHHSMAPPTDDFFRRARRWRLSVYDHDGRPEHFHFDLRDGRISRAKGSAELGWTTEVPAARLYGALVEGETLTSMYLRINDGDFSPAVKAEIAMADPLEDPLISALFHEPPGAYQRAQLARRKRDPMAKFLKSKIR